LTGGLDLQADESKRWNFPFIYIDTPNIDEAAEKIKANGGQVIKEKYLMPGIGYAAVVKDTEGNQFFLYKDL
jgi:predicted enzyme related to lactoylglutathione lyase